MKKIISVLVFCLCLVTIKNNAQNTSCGNAQALIFPVVNYNAIGTTFNNELWYSVQVGAGSFNFDLANLNSPSVIYAANIYDGSCMGLNFITTDSLTNPSDSLLNIIITNTQVTNTYFIKLKTNDFSAYFEMNINPLSSPPICTTCVSEMIPNGGFESGLICGPINAPTNSLLAIDCWTANTHSPDLFRRFCPNIFFGTQANLGINTYNTFTMGISAPFNNHIGLPNPNNAILGIAWSDNLGFPDNSESMRTTLTTPLVAGQAYTLRFWANQFKGTFIDGYNGTPYTSNPAPSQSVSPSVISIVASSGIPNPTLTSPFPDLGNSTLLQSFTLAPTFNKWNYYTINFVCPPAAATNVTFAIGINGVLTEALSVAQTPALAGLQNLQYVFFDDLSLTTSAGIASLNIPNPSPVCSNTPIINLAQYVSPPSFTTTGVFSGPGVTGNYDFNINGNLPVGTYPITFSYTNAANCPLTVTQIMTVSSAPMPTINVNVSSICSVPGTTILLSASSNYTNLGYTWFPGGTPSPTLLTLAPNGITIFNVVATNGTCSTSKTIAAVGQNFTISCNTTSNIICLGATATLSANGVGAASFTWNPGIVNQTLAVTPSLTTNYSVTATSALGCTNNCVVTQSVYPLNINFFTITATPSVICSGLGQTSTLTAPGATNYVWTPSGLTNTFLVTATPGIYSCSATYTNNCIYTKTISLSGTNTYAALAQATICSTSTLDLLTLVTAPAIPGGTFTLGGNPIVGTTTIGAQPSNTYLVVYTHTANLLCNNTATTIVTVIPMPPNINIVPSNVLVCGGGDLTLTAIPNPTNAPNPYSYTWQPAPQLPGVNPTNPAVYTPTIGQTFTVVTGSGQCTTTATLFVDYLDTPCNCLTGCTNTLFGPVYSDPITGMEYCVTNNLTIPSNTNITFSRSAFRIYPNVSITVSSNATLNIIGCHLYSCDELWNGIIVQQGGVLNFLSYNNPLRPKTCFIEDAKIAVDILDYNLGPNVQNILTVDESIFNSNLINIRIGKYDKNQVNYPFTIQNSLFTSRTITYTPLNWPLTSAVKSSTTGNGPMQTPYVNNALYPPIAITSTNIIAPTFPYNGIILNRVGRTLMPSMTTYRYIEIGQNGPNNFNCFDNLQEDITATNSNLVIKNSVFQNGVRYGSSLNQGGRAISAISTSNDEITFNNHIQITSSVLNGNFNCRFYEKTSCADIEGYLSTVIRYCEAYSISNAYTKFNIPNIPGDRGFNIRTNRYEHILLQKNKLYNIKNAMMINLYAGTYIVGNQFGSGRYVGQIDVTENIVDKHITTPTGSEYVNIALSIADPFSGTAVGYSPFGPHVLIRINKFNRVHNGADVRDVSFGPVGISSNTITMANEPPPIFNFTPPQFGIKAVQLQKHININRNIVSGPTLVPYSTEMKAITTAINASLVVRCNTTALTARGIEFNNGQTTDFFEDNIMQDQSYGLVLDNNAVLTATNALTIMGDPNRPTNNVWQEPWAVAGGFKTLTTGGSSAQNGKLYIDITSNTLNPANSTTTSGIMNTDNYFFVPSNTISTLFQSTITPQPSCRIDFGGGGGGNNASQAVMEQMVTNNITYSNNINQTQFINKTMAYRTLKANPGIMIGSNILNNFSLTAQSNCLEAFCAIEDNLMNGNINAAQAQITALTPTNNIESNYQNFYQIVKRDRDSTYTNTDSLNLITLANLCPYIDGGVVFQAQALYNIIYTGYYKFNENCAGPLAKNSLPSSEMQNESRAKINVILKTNIFPNPNDGNYVLRINKVIEKENVEIRIFDITGKEVLRENKLLQNENEVKLSNNLLNGTYLIKVKLEDGNTDVHRLIINK